MKTYLVTLHDANNSTSFGVIGFYDGWQNAVDVMKSEARKIAWITRKDSDYQTEYKNALGLLKIEEMIQVKPAPEDRIE